jgi:hypothetical protein
VATGTITTAVTAAIATMAVVAVVAAMATMAVTTATIGAPRTIRNGSAAVVFFKYTSFKALARPRFHNG